MDSFTIAGLIFMIVLGPAVGNYACSVVYRLPRGQTPFEKKPYCGHCGAMLQPRDLFPLISFLLTRGKCRFCGDPIRVSYFVIELLCLLVFVSNFLLFGFSEDFILLSALAVFLIILVFIDYHEGFLSNYVMTVAIFIAGIYRVRDDATFYLWFQHGFMWLFAAACLWQALRRGKGVLGEVPHWVWLSGLAGFCIPRGIYAAPLLLLYGMAAGMILYAIQRMLSHWRSPSAAFCAVIYGLVVLMFVIVRNWAIQP